MINLVPIRWTDIFLVLFLGACSAPPPPICQPGTCSAGASTCRNLSGLVESICKPLPDGSCPVPLASASEICDESCCARLTCVPADGTCVPTMVAK